VSIPARSVVLDNRRNEIMPETKKVTASPPAQPVEKPHTMIPTGPKDLKADTKPVIDTPGAMPVDGDRP
jgi:hypothetical protein